jgi:hypothetical protein
MANRQLTTGGTIVAATGVVFLLDSFLPWHRLCLSLPGAKVCGSHNAWHTAFSLLATLLVVALVAEVVAVQVLDRGLPPVGNFTWSQVRLVVAGAAFVLVVIQLLVGDNGLNRSYGLFLGLLLSAGLLYGTYLRTSEPEPAPL